MNRLDLTRIIRWRLLGEAPALLTWERLTSTAYRLRPTRVRFIGRASVRIVGRS